jgi:hypothetical protein
MSMTFSAIAADYEKEYAIAPGGKLELETDSGAIRVLTHSGSVAKVEAHIEGEDAEDFSVSSSVSGDTLKVRGTVDGKKWSRHLKVEFIITVPEQFSIDLDTAGGSIEISDLTGNIDARTSGGSIRVGTIKGDVELDTSGGSIKTEEVYGALNAHTSGGSIKATFAEQLKDDAILDTSGGSITAYIIQDAQIDLDASTSGGRVKTDFTVNGRVKKRSIRGEINGGGPTLKLRTSGGSVSVLSL